MDRIATVNAVLADQLATIEEDMPELQLAVHKTMVQANRCHIGKLEDRIKECVSKINSMKSRLSQNEAAIQETSADVRTVAGRVKAVLDKAAEVANLAAEADKCAVKVLELCQQARSATQLVRDKLFTDAQQRRRIEEEAARREEKERSARELEEKLALEAQV